MVNIIKTNEAPDGGEHTGKYQVFNLDPRYRTNAFGEFAKTHPDGRELYPIIMKVASRVDNYAKYGDSTQEFMPETRTPSYPSYFFTPQIPKRTFIEESQQAEGVNLSAW